MALTGLTQLSGLQQITDDTPEATAEEIHGNPANEFHGHAGEEARPYSWESQQTQAGSHTVSPFESVDDEFYGILPAGTLGQDPTAETKPWTHAAPWPKDPIGDGSVHPGNTIRQVTVNAFLRSIVNGGKRNVYSPSLYANNDSWQEIWEVDPNSTDLTEVPAQMRSGAAPGGRGHTDRTQSNARQNSYGFDSRHMHRRFATGHVPGNSLWMRPAGRPLVKSLPGPARPAIGQGSPFQGDNLGAAFSPDGAILTGPATEYTAPPQPYIAPVTDGTATASGSYLDDYGI
jgi:hypothetical protein